MRRPMIVGLIGATLLLHLALLGQTPKSQAGAEDDARTKAIVDRFYPKELIDPYNPEDRDSCFAVYDRAPDGTPLTILVDYSQGDGEMFALSRKSSGNYAAINITPKEFEVEAVFCSINLVDVDGDGRNEVEVALTGADPTSVSFIFRWDGMRLRSIGETVKEDHSIYSTLNNIRYANLYDDGTLAVVNMDEDSRDEDAPIPTSIYRLRKGSYKFAVNSIYSFGYLASSKSYPLESNWFNVEKTSVGPYVLRIGNGDQFRKGRVTAAIVTINGTNLNLKNFTAQVGTFTLPIPKGLIKRSNIIKVRAEGAANAIMDLIIEDHSPQTSVSP